ncbi:MAG TPA: serine hydrolase domain-containing protein [Candidatus Acidoferrum sp.]|nr:serine hydrolase domain-containing protein [Candidatus Acidoferrum sp.]
MKPTSLASLRNTIWRASSITVVLLLFAIAPAPLRAQTKTLSAEKRAQIQKTASSFMAANSVPGISAAVVRDGELVWSEGFGMADLENFVPATPATLFRLASISKPITATAILQLYERGKLDLDAEVQKYCPAFPKKEWPITTRELLGHLGGIRHYNPDGKGDIPEDSARHFASMEESLQVFANDPLVARPGTKFQYSTYGYTLLGCVLEGASSQKYLDFVKESVFDPAGMEETQADNFFSVIPHRTRWYHKDKAGVVQNAGVLDSSYKIPGGGLISSADDMARFAIALLSSKLVKPATRDLMWTSQKTSDGAETGYALGWAVSRKYFDLFTVAHSGGQQGTSTFVMLIPERRAAVVVLANMDNVDAGLLGRQVLKIALDLTGKPE